MPKVVITLNTSWNIFNHRLGLLKELEKEGFDIVCVAPEDDYSALIPYQYVNWEINKRGMNPFQELFSINKLKKIYAKLKPDIALHFTIKPNIYGSVVCKQLKIPFINNVSGLGFGFQEGESFIKVKLGWLYQKTLCSANKVFFQNKDDMALFVNQNPALSNISTRLPGSGVDVDRFKPNTNEIIEEELPFTFLMGARLFKEKGVVEYLEAASMIKKKFPHTRFLLLGDIYKMRNNPITAELINKYVQLKVVDYLGMQKDMLPYFYQCNCVVLPTYYREGCPKVLIEAASCGLPIITTDHIGCRDIVVNEHNGLLCEKMSVVHLKECMEKILTMPKSALSLLGQNGRKKVLEEFDQKIIFKEYIDSIKKILF